MHSGRSPCVSRTAFHQALDVHSACSGNASPPRSRRMSLRAARQKEPRIVEQLATVIIGSRHMTAACHGAHIIAWNGRRFYMSMHDDDTTVADLAAHPTWPP